VVIPGHPKANPDQAFDAEEMQNPLLPWQFRFPLTAFFHAFSIKGFISLARFAQAAKPPSFSSFLYVSED
jgi:hypothetical protein